MSQDSIVSEDGSIEVDLPKIKGIKGYRVLVSGDEDFAGNVQAYSYKKNKTTATIKGLAEGSTYYVRTYGYKSYNGVKIYKNE